MRINPNEEPLSTNTQSSNRFQWLYITHYGLVTPYGDMNLGQIGSGNGLVPDGTKPLPEPMLTYHQQGPVAFTWVQKIPQPSVTEISWTMTYLKFCSNLPGANELNIGHQDISFSDGHQDDTPYCGTVTIVPTYYAAILMSFLSSCTRLLRFDVRHISVTTQNWTALKRWRNTLRSAVMRPNLYRPNTW